MTSGYALGIDFGTLSGRAVLVEVGTGREVATAVKEYRHGVIDAILPATGERLPPDYALQDPGDYREVLREVVPAVLARAGVTAAEVVGVGIDATACTLLPTKADGTPLCFLPEFRGNRHAYATLWKHHAAQEKARRMTAVAEARGETFLPRYGGKVSSEWLVPKVWQVLDEAPEVYAAADRFLEAADWIVAQLTGVEARNSCAAGYKAFWSRREGYPPKEYFRALDPRLENLVDDKLSRDIRPVGSRAGVVSAEGAALTGLLPGTAVAVGNVDAHVAVPAVGIVEPGRMLMTIGTSTCHMLLGDREIAVPGMCGVVEDGIVPGYLGYEAGQSCVGDHFDWFVRNCVPASYMAEAEAEGVGIHRYLRGKAKRLRVGESGLVALDWWNGNRSVLVDGDLTGLMIGMTLQTKPEEVYRALIEATAFGTRMIVETFERSGVPVHELYACGGIAEKDEFLMQVYSDVTRRGIRLSASSQTVALGAAMTGAVAAGREKGGHGSIQEAAKAMAHLRDVVYRPDPKAADAYDRLFAEYRRLHDHFGRGGDDVMKRLKELKAEARSRS